MAPSVASTSGSRLVVILLLAVAVIGGTILAGRDRAFVWFGIDNPGRQELQQAWAEVRQAPQEPVAWQRLGDAQSSIDQVRSAEESYRTAIRLTKPEARGQLYGRLGFLLYSRGLDEPALAMFIRAEELNARLPMLQQTLNRLRNDSQAQKPVAITPVVSQSARVGVAERECEVVLTRSGSGVYLVRLVIGEVEASLVVDTGASITALAESFVVAQDIPIDTDASIVAVTAAGRTRLATAIVPRFALAGEEVVDKMVAVCDQCGGTDAVGLMGLDLQAALGVSIDLQGSRLRFLDCGNQ